MSGLITFIAKVVEFLFKFIVTVICTALGAIGMLDIFRWPECFADLGRSCGKRITMYWGICCMSFVAFFGDMFTLIPFALTLPTWRSPFMLHSMCKEVGCTMKSSDFNYNEKARAVIWVNFALMMLDIPTIFLTWLSVLTFWRVPYVVIGIAKNLNMRQWERPCSGWRIVGFTHFLIGLGDIFTLFLLLIGCFNPYRLLTKTIPAAREAYNRCANSYGTPRDFMVPEWRMEIIAGGVVGVGEAICFILFCPCLLFPWRWADIYFSLDITKPKPPPVSATSSTEPAAGSSSGTRHPLDYTHQVPWYVAGPANLLLGLLDVFVAFFFVLCCVTWRLPTMVRALRKASKDYRDGGQSPMRYNVEARLVVMSHVIKIIADVPFIFMAVFTLVTLLRAYSLIRRLVLVARDKKEQGHHPDSWVFCDYRRPILTEFFKALIYIIMLPLFFVLCVTIYRVPTLIRDIKKERESVRSVYRRKMQAAAAATTAPSDAATAADFAGSAEAEREPGSSYHAHTTPPPESDQGKLTPTEERKMSDDLFFSTLAIIAMHCLLVLVDIPCMLLGVITFMLLIRAHKLFRQLTCIPSHKLRSVASVRRVAVLENLILSFRDWLFVFLTPLVLISPPRFVGIFTSLCQKLQRDPEPTPLVHIVEAVPAFVHGQGWQLKIKGLKPRDLRISNAQIDFVGDRFWKSFSKAIGSVVTLAAGTVLPHELTPKYLDLAKVNVDTVVFDVVVDLRANIKRSTIIKKLKLLDQYAPIEIIVSCDDRSRTLFALTTTSHDLLDSEEKQIPLPLAGLRACPYRDSLEAEVAALEPPREVSEDSEVTRITREFSEAQPQRPPTPPPSRTSGVAGGTTTSAAPVSAVQYEVSVKTFGPYFCDHYWHIVALQLGQALLDWFAIFCFFLAHIVPFRAVKMYSQLFMTSASYQERSAADYLAYHLKTIDRINGAKHVKLLREQELYVQNALGKTSHSERYSHGASEAMSHTLSYFAGETRSSVASLTSASRGQGKAGADLMRIYLANIFIVTLAHLRAVSSHRKRLLGREEERKTIAERLTTGGVSAALSQLVSTLRSIGSPGSGPAAGATTSSSIDRDAEEAAEEARRQRNKHRTLKFGRGISREEEVHFLAADFDLPSRGGAFNENEPASAIDQIADALKAEILNLVSGADPELLAAYMLSVDYYEALSDSGVKVDEESFAATQEGIVKNARNTVLPLMRKSENALPCFAASAATAHSWDEMRTICMYHALMVLPDLVVFIGVLLIVASVYRIPSLVRLMYRERRWRRYLPLIFGEMLLDVIFILMWLFVMVTLRFAIELNLALLYAIVVRRSYYACRWTIYHYCCAVFSEFFRLLEVIFTMKIIRYIIAVVVVGIVTPAELVSHNLQGRVCGCEAWPFVLMGTMIYYAFPFVIVYGSNGGDAYLPILYAYGACIAIALLLILLLVLSRGIRERRNTATAAASWGFRGSGVAAQDVVEMESVSFSHLPITSATAFAFFLILFEGYQLSSLAVSFQSNWGDGFDWVATAAQHATLSNVSVGDLQYPVGFWLAIAFGFLYFLILAAPLVINDVLKHSSVNITGQRPWQVATFLIGPVLALSMAVNLVGFSVCSESAMRNFTHVEPLNFTNSSLPSELFNVTTVTREVRFMTVGSRPGEQLCWISDNKKAYGVIAMILMVFYAPTAALRSTRWSEPIRHFTLRFHELHNTVLCIAHVVLGALRGYLHARPEAYCGVQIAVMLILIVVTWRNQGGLLPVPRNTTSSVVNTWRVGAHLVALISAVITIASLHVDAQFLADGKMGIILVVLVGSVAVFSWVRTKCCSDEDETLDGNLTTLLNDIAALEKSMAAAGRMVSWTSSAQAAFHRRLGRATTSQDIGDALLELERHIDIAAMRRLYYLVRPDWTLRVDATRFRPMNLGTLRRFEELAQSLKNGTSTTPVADEAAREVEHQAPSGFEVSQTVLDVVRAIAEKRTATPPPAANPAFTVDDL